SIVGDPYSAAYDCYNRSIFVNGPTDPNGRQSAVNYSLSWLHTFKGGSLNLQLYRQNAHGQAMYAAVPILAEPSSLFPGGLSAYLAGLQSVWNSSSYCGAIPFATDRIYVQQAIAGLGQATEGGTFSGRIPIGHSLFALPNFAYGRAYLTSLDPRLEAPNSFYAIGRQLPHRPLYTAGLTLDGTLPRARLEWLINAQFSSANNSRNLSAYTSYNTGLVFQSKTGGTFTLVESNIFGTRSGLFTVYQGAYPIPVVGGGSFAFASSPLSPRQWLFTWRLPWSQHVAPPKAAPPTSPSPKPSPSLSAKP
ncbi:MAG: hypothetical protein M3R30_00365, partial [Candidatus Eremiobacteraeota bacterium]|nr:hypothetical protein [Candidatus Eremiobacteraeota bacterium]